ncbi:MAG TPA: nicotinate-nucleotide adenylyltransferase [Pyrinomonadaceae bacterium]|nr:nicotinate-nucleotide adenylyltransferase [Pyrinomonadaceae bacterium]
MDQKRRIGIYGGTFDPVHSGHIELARRVSQLFEIDTVVFVPALLAPHKLKRTTTSPLHRYAMLVLATENEPGLRVSTFEMEASDRRYTVDTVAYFQAQFAGGAELFFIMGADSWSEITTWHEWERLLAMTNHIVVTRPGFEVEIDHLPAAVQKRVVDVRGPGGPAKAAAVQLRNNAIFISDAVMIDVSATDIRRAAIEGRFSDFVKWVPGPVARYVQKYSLYRESNEA